MKKLISVAIAGVAATACAFAFTACGGDKETTYTVTADEWKTAINIIVEGKNNFECEWSYKSDDEEGKYILKYDYANSIVGFADAGTSGMEVYAWKEAEDDYRYSSFGSNGYDVYKSDKEEFEKGQKDNIFEYGGGLFLPKYSDKFADFTYSEDLKEYTLTDSIEEMDGMEFEISVKIENAKIVNVSAKGDELSYSFKYTYGTSATVPDHIKNLPVTER